MATRCSLRSSSAARPAARGPATCCACRFPARIPRTCRATGPWASVRTIAPCASR